MDIDGITTAVENIIVHLNEGDSVLIEEYILCEELQHEQRKFLIH